MSEYVLKSAEESASARGLVVVEPAADELFIDLDSENAFSFFSGQLAQFGAAFGVIETRVAPSASKLPHRHATIKLNREVSNLERILFQAILGSDRKREALSYMCLLQGREHPTVFFERPFRKPEQAVPLADIVERNRKEDEAWL